MDESFDRIIKKSAEASRGVDGLGKNVDKLGGPMAALTSSLGAVQGGLLGNVAAFGTAGKAIALVSAASIAAANAFSQLKRTQLDIALAAEGASNRLKRVGLDADSVGGQVLTAFENVERGLTDFGLDRFIFGLRNARDVAKDLTKEADEQQKEWLNKRATRVKDLEIQAEKAKEAKAREAERVEVEAKRSELQNNAIATENQLRDLGIQRAVKADTEAMSTAEVTEELNKQLEIAKHFGAEGAKQARVQALIQALVAKQAEDEAMFAEEQADALNAMRIDAEEEFDREQKLKDQAKEFHDAKMQWIADEAERAKKADEERSNRLRNLLQMLAPQQQQGAQPQPSEAEQRRAAFFQRQAALGARFAGPQMGPIGLGAGIEPGGVDMDIVRERVRGQLIRERRKEFEQQQALQVGVQGVGPEAKRQFQRQRQAIAAGVDRDIAAGGGEDVQSKLADEIAKAAGAQTGANAQQIDLMKQALLEATKQAKEADQMQKDLATLKAQFDALAGNNNARRAQAAIRQ